MVNLDEWSRIIEYVKQFQHQEDVLVPKDSIVDPKTAGIPYTWGAYRLTIEDGRAIDIKEEGDHYLVHWDWHNPETHLIQHAIEDAPLLWLLVATGIGDLINPKGMKGKGDSRGVDLSLWLLLLRGIAVTT